MKDDIAIARREALRQVRAELARIEQALDETGERDAAQYVELQRQLALLRNTVQRHLQQFGDGMTALRTVLYSEWPEWDGEIIAVDPNESLAWIDLDGERGLRPGAIFQVVSFDKGRRRRVDAFLEVERIMSGCSLVLVRLAPPHEGPEGLPRASEPISTGDLIDSPLFDREERPVFVILGTGLQSSDREELERRIEEAGARIDPNVTIETDYAVALEGYDQDAVQYDTARQFGVVFLTLDELLDFIPRSGGRDAR